MASANSHTRTVAAGETWPASGGYAMPFQSFSTYTFQVIPSGGASVAIQGSVDGTNFTNMTGMGAITTAAITQWSNPLPFVRFVVTVGGSAIINWAWSDNK